MAWPLRLRTMSFVIVIGVVMMEAAIALIPIGVDAMRVVRNLSALAFAISIAIAIHGDLGRQGYRKWWRLRA